MFTGLPRVPEKYDQVLADDIKVYIAQDANIAPEGLKISLGNWRGFPTLEVKGLLTY
ncbi:hypothetical protein SPSYN_02514 [Sporotomaculum syntrophicum]|uniref:Uncharacterized protein n=1 Tax=Sporotomaculum syntrophicum TaxID=182264 RepID=A0A9D2WP23_9FIRM|nr:hypothetical protein SPSYN_02514 [Sporotomaculum syntrophicum]